mmetsp:Transcript_53789/g.96352  ORF Transcript_53789/g.96352 Transcript_53789/m.96352 type:complete len:153 (+) Transcript_53789:35-493(+)
METYPKSSVAVSTQHLTKHKAKLLYLFICRFPSKFGHLCACLAPTSEALKSCYPRKALVEYSLLKTVVASFSLSFLALHALTTQLHLPKAPIGVSSSSPLRSCQLLQIAKRGPLHGADHAYGHDQLPGAHVQRPALLMLPALGAEKSRGSQQ